MQAYQDDGTQHGSRKAASAQGSPQSIGLLYAQMVVSTEITTCSMVRAACPPSSQVRQLQSDGLERCPADLQQRSSASRVHSACSTLFGLTQRTSCCSSPKRLRQEARQCQQQHEPAVGMAVA